jgi:hypothetical protein
MSPAWGKIYYVSPTGSDSNSGTTIAAAFATPQRGVNAATRPGDIVAILPGAPYGGGVGTTPPIVLGASGSGASTTAGGSCSAPITIEGYALSPQRPIINGVAGASGGGAIFGYGVSCIVISGLELAGWNSTLLWPGISANAAASGTGWQNPMYIDYGLVLSGNTGAATHHLTLKNLYVHDFPGGGIGFAYSDYVSVLQNVVVNNGQYSPFQGSGISLYENKNIDTTTTTHSVVSGNLVAGNANQVPSRNIGIYQHTASYTPAGQSYISVDSTAGLNWTQAVLDVPGGCVPPNTTVYDWNASRIFLSNPISCAILSGDTIITGYETDGEGIIIDNTSESQSGIYGVPYTARTLVINNVTMNNGGAGIQCGPVSAHCDIAFNTSYLDQAGAGIVGNSYSPGGVNVSLSSDVNIYNNLIYAGPQVALIWDQSTSGARWGNNLLFGGIAGNFGHTIPGSNNVVGEDPVFVAPGINLATANFHLLPGSAATGAGSTLFTRSVDFGGNAVSSGNPPDIGAYLSTCITKCSTAVSDLMK